MRKSKCRMNVQNPNINQIGQQSHVTVRLYIHMVIMVLGLTLAFDRPAPRKPRPEGRGQGELYRNVAHPFREAPSGRAGRLHSLDSLIPVSGTLACPSPHGNLFTTITMTGYASHA